MELPMRSTSAVTTALILLLGTGVAEAGKEISVKGLTGGYARDVSLSFRAAEVVGLTGLLGSGFEEIAYCVFGARSAAAGRRSAHHRS